jgi:ammonium transporter, Amt family
LDGVTKIRGGWVNHHYMQVLYQLCNCVTGFVYAFFVTYAILIIMNLIPGLSLRVSEESEFRGIDLSELGENAYEFVGTDYKMERASPSMVNGATLALKESRESTASRDGKEGKEEKAE